MRKSLCVGLVVALSAVAVYLCSCVSSGGTLLDPKDPIFPPPELKEGVVDPTTRVITITKDGITATAEHWSRTRLNRKYTTVDMRSPFYYLETWAQGFHSEVFHATVKNDGTRSVILKVGETILEDDRQYKYTPSKVQDFEYKFVTKKYMDLKTKRGLELAPQIMLGGAAGADTVVPVGETRSGFLSFTTPSSQASKVWLTLVLEKEPETATAAYERVEFRFDFMQDPVLRASQTPVKR